MVMQLDKGKSLVVMSNYFPFGGTTFIYLKIKLKTVLQVHFVNKLA